MTLNRPIILETERCILKEMALSDNQYWFQFMTNEKINKYLPDRIESVEEMSNVIKWLISNYNLETTKIDRLTLGINMKSGIPTPIGWVTFGELPENDELKEIGYAIHPDHWGNGFATEAVKKFVKYIMRNLYNLDLYATVDKNNIASIRVLEKIGMERIIDTKDYVKKDNLNHDLYVYKNGRKVAG